MYEPNRILKNLFSLSLAEFANKGLTFITTAYLGRMLLPEGFGIIGSANSIVAYFVLFSTFSLNAIGTRDVSKSRDLAHKYLQSIVSIRLLLGFIAYFALIILVLFIDKPPETKTVILICGFNIFAQALLIDWLYQALEQMHVIALRQIITCLLNLLGVVLFVSGRYDTALAMSILTGSLMLNSIWMLLYYIRKNKSSIINSDYKHWLKLIKTGAPIFISNIVVLLVNNLHLTLLTAFRSEVEVGYFFAAFKIYLLTVIPVVIIQNSFYPSLSRAETLAEKQKISLKYCKLNLFVGNFVTGMLITFPNFWTGIAFGAEYAETAEILRILTISSIFVNLNMSYFPTLIAWGKEKQAMLATFVSGTVCIAFNFILVPLWGPKGAAIATIITEVVFSVAISKYFLKESGIHHTYQFFKFLLIIAIACVCGYLLLMTTGLTIISIIVTALLYLALNLAFKTIQIQEVMNAFKK
jgi:O-antigen/teichoic acid export membrane protein